MDTLRPPARDARVLARQPPQLDGPHSPTRNLFLSGMVLRRRSGSPSTNFISSLSRPVSMHSGAGIIYARNHMWDVPSANHGHWNTDFPYISAFTCTAPIATAQGDKTAFLGSQPQPSHPRKALSEERWQPTFGRHEDPVAATRSIVELQPNQQHKLGYVLAVAESDDVLDRTLAQSSSIVAMETALEETRLSWQKRLASPSGQNSRAVLELPDQRLASLSGHRRPDLGTLRLLSAECALSVFVTNCRIRRCG